MGCKVGTTRRCTLHEGCTRADMPCALAFREFFRYYITFASTIVASTVFTDRYGELPRPPPDAASFRPDMTTVHILLLCFLLAFRHVGSRSTTLFSWPGTWYNEIGTRAKVRIKSTRSRSTRMNVQQVFYASKDLVLHVRTFLSSWD